ncbi:outer membrane lipoprotein chaperone LolA [Noviherbaspirillum pedocola]|uniref:Outer-membrane lipoprotein carrier protein n=1 Tax=Noviherbaspirillum pedocola TaxID=2801341 RepID=A0A934W8K6_9BURK|nr:outer membrane lipoprotein chaperone LolA [Noviherbaspirillum pedocola]MBK4736903.1 outer membrane lipoprotein chaperone LolA [Noviherbaspirillum pedocola]
MNTGRKTFASIVALVAAALTLPSLAQATALDQFKSFVAATKSARGDFTQRVTKNDGAAKAATTSSGTFEFARPGRFIWTYRKPYEQVLQADGERLYIYDRDLNQVTVRKLGNALGSSPAAILFGSNDLEKNFTLKEGGEHDGMEWLQVTPKAKDTSFEQVGIGMRDGLPGAMELRDSFGQVTMLTFTRFEKNPQLPPGHFKFTAPKGADVLEQ